MVLVDSADGPLASMVRVISVFGVVDRIFVASANHVRKGSVAVGGRTLQIIPEGDRLERLANEYRLLVYS
jgi:hypothetical protein